MKIIAYIVCLFGILLAFTAENDKQMYVGAIMFGAGFLVYAVVRILDRIDPDGAED